MTLILTSLASAQVEFRDNNDSNTSMLQQEVAAGISVQTILIGLLAVLTSGLLFRRSSYILKF